MDELSANEGWESSVPRVQADCPSNRASRGSELLWWRPTHRILDSEASSTLRTRDFHSPFLGMKVFRVKSG